MDMPPTRYRVVEQGRRLIVIDTQAGRSSTPPAFVSRREVFAGRPNSLEGPRPEPGKAEPRGRYAGGEGFSFVTARWYDGEGPRRIRLDPDGTTQLIAVLLISLVVAGFFVTLIGWPVLLVLGFLAFNPKVRTGLGKVGATWLTALDRSQ
jgi:hypothetical protein